LRGESPFSAAERELIAAYVSLWRAIGITGKKAKCRQPINPGKYDEEKTAEFPKRSAKVCTALCPPRYPLAAHFGRT